MFAVFVLSLAALLCTLLALRRHIRNHHARPGEPAPLSDAHHEDAPTHND